MRRYWMFGALAFLSFTILKPTALHAHHNQFQGFDKDREQVVTGTVERFSWQNPHAYIYLSSGESNDARSWRIETLSISFMRQLGWGPDTIRAGDNVTVTINPSRTEGRATGWLIDIAVEGRDVPSLTDEKRIGAIISGESTQTDAKANSVSGTWISQTGPAAQWKWIDDPSQLRLTEAGQRAVDSYNPANTSSKASCEPRPIPRVMIAGDRKSIELVDDVAWIRAEYDATERIAYFDARPPEGRTVHGHSLARWQDGVLIVETSNFTENPNGITDGFPSSNEKHLVERFALNANGQSLVYSFELTDPVYLAEPLTGEMRWLYRPNVDFELVPCDPGATRSFLDN
jgi:uncharacterized protein DUF6152